MLATSRPAARLLFPAALLLGVAVLLGGTSRPARALAEADVDFSVSQSPSAPATVQVGSTVTFTVTATVNTAPVGVPLFFELDYPSGLSFLSGSSSPAGVTCTNNVPAAGVVRCDYGTVSTGPRVPLTLTFAITADAVTAPADARMRAGASDGAPDSAADGGDSFAGAGTLTVFTAGNFTVTAAASPAAIFEGGTAAYTVTLANNSSASTGTFDASVTFSGASISGESCSFGTASRTGAVVTCTGANLAPSASLTITATVAAPDSADGTDITAVLDAPGLGISNHASTGVTVHEIGLVNTGATLAIGTPINVCTATVPADLPMQAAGEAQPGNASLLVGSPSLQPILQVGDFTVTGPGSPAVTPAVGCASGQSGVRFTPAVAGTYTVRANYNVGGNNILTLVVPGSGSNPLPVLDAISPASAPAGSGPITLSLTGSGFIAASEVRWNGSPLAGVTLNSSTSLSVSVPASLLANPGTASVTVSNPSPGGGTSAAQTFTINPVASRLAFTTQPSDGTAGQPLPTQPVVAVQSATGVTITTDNSTVVTLAISGSATLTCDGGLSKTVTAGVAAFTGCRITPAGTGYTLTATSSPALTPATSTTFSISAAPPTPSSQLVVIAPAGLVPRSRLIFTVNSGSLAPAQVEITIRRTSDNRYWNAQTAAWQADPVRNPAASAGSAAWTLAVTGADRRQFVNTTVVVEAFATAGSNQYVSQSTATIVIR